jgi:cytidylate kinase
VRLPFIVAVDGPSGSGKSSVCATACKQLGFVYVNTGQVYRCVAWLLGEWGIETAAESVICDRVAQEVTHITWDTTLNRFLYRGQDLTAFLYAESVGLRASKVAKSAALRKLLLPLQRHIALHTTCSGAIVDGRDIASVVFPDAKLKIFMEASVEVRAKRRLEQLQSHGSAPDLIQLQEQMQERDHQDSTREIAPLQREHDAVVLDTSHMGFEESVAALVGMIRERAKSLKIELR